MFDFLAVSGELKFYVCLYRWEVARYMLMCVYI